MADPKDDDAGGPSRTNKCANCGAPFASDQRYCVDCGTRRGPLPRAIAAQISLILRRWRLPEEAKAAGLAAAKTEEPEQEPQPAPSSYMPSPRVAAIAVMAMLALGVLLGSATSQIAQSAGVSAIVLESAASTPPPAEEPEEEPVETASAAEPEPVEEATPSTASYEEEPAPEEEPVPETPAEEPELVPFNPEEPETDELPPVKHVFLIVLGENGFEETYGETSTAPYLSKTLPEKGELLENFYAVTGGVLANEIALLSGQGPTQETALNCPNYADITPGTESAEKQVEGNGCVYPATTETIASQLVAKDLTWRAYVEDMEKGPLTGQAASCRHPELGTADANQAPIGEDAYVTWRNPFVYFHSIIDGEECATNDVGLEALTTDLRSAKRTPTLSYIVPNACHSGGETPCAEGALTGPAASEEFLKKVIPAITASEAYKEGGLIAITSAQAPRTGEHTDFSACCVYPEYVNVPPAEGTEELVAGTRNGGGGGKVGMLLISPYVKAGSVNEESKFNDFSFLLTLEELFELEKLGYSQEPALTPFESSVFNYAEEGESTGEEPPAAGSTGEEEPAAAGKTGEKEEPAASGTTGEETTGTK